MRKIKRVGRFGLVGIVATMAHGLVLLALIRTWHIATGPANMLAFIVAFCFSMSAQQAFTFQDRLAGQKLRKRSLTILFLTNSLLAYWLGSLAHGPWIASLMFVPSLCNFLLLHFFSGHPAFKG